MLDAVGGPPSQSSRGSSSEQSQAREAVPEPRAGSVTSSEGQVEENVRTIGRGNRSDALAWSLGYLHIYPIGLQIVLPTRSIRVRNGPVLRS